MKKCLISTLMSIVLLGGCGGDDTSSDDGNSGNNDSPSIIAQDIIKLSSPQKAISLTLGDYIQLSSPTSNVSVKSFKQISNATTPLFCSNYSINALQISIAAPEVTGECAYEYVVESGGATSETALMRVGFSNFSTSTISLSATAAIGARIAIDVTDNLPTGYVLDKGHMLVLGSGVIDENLSEPNIIYYTAGEHFSDAGVTRVLLNFKNDSTESIILVTIAISVSDTGRNHAPLAFDFRYGDRSAFTIGQQLPYINVPIGKEVIIDVAPYFNKGYLDNNGNKIEMIDSNGDYFYDEANTKINFYLKSDGSTTDVYAPGLLLIDPDKHPLQLVKAHSYTANVAPFTPSTGADSELTNTSFRFSSVNPGKNYVTYILSDHHGAYASGLVEINVGLPLPWKPRLKTKTAEYLAPYDYATVVQKNIVHVGESVEDGVNGPIGFSTALFTYDQANNFCATFGLELPTKGDLDALKQDYAKGLYLSLDKYALTSGDRERAVSWPVSMYYWTKSEAAGTTTAYSLADYNTKSVSITGDNERFAATCIAKGVIHILNITKPWAYRLPYDSGDSAHITVTVTDNFFSPVQDVTVTTVADGYTLIRGTNSGRTDSNGRVTFYVSSTKARETTPIKFTAGFSTITNDQIAFKDLPKYVRTRTWNSTSDLCFYDTMEKMARNNCWGEAALIRTSLWQGASYDSYFIDNFYVYRIWGPTLYRTRSFTGAASPLSLPASENYGSYPMQRPDPYTSYHSMTYDGTYYWVINGSKSRIEAYLKVDDLVKQVNMVKSFPWTGLVTLTIVYDPGKGVFWRTVGVNSSSDEVRAYPKMEDAAALNENFTESYPFFNPHPNLSAGQHNFSIFN